MCVTFAIQDRTKGTYGTGCGKDDDVLYFYCFWSAEHPAPNLPATTHSVGIAPVNRERVAIEEEIRGRIAGYRSHIWKAEGENPKMRVSVRIWLLSPVRNLLSKLGCNHRLATVSNPFRTAKSHARVSEGHSLRAIVRRVFLDPVLTIDSLMK